LHLQDLLYYGPDTIINKPHKFIKLRPSLVELLPTFWQQVQVH